MAYDENLAQRVRDALSGQKGLSEKKMFGGLSFLLNGNMCCGVVGEDLVARVGPQRYKEALERPDARPMDFTGKPLTGFVYVAQTDWSSGAELREWLDLAVAFARSLPEK